MNAIRIQSLGDAGDVRAPVGSPAWCKAVYLELRRLKRDGEAAITNLKYNLINFRQNNYYRSVVDRNGSPFSTWEDFVQYPEPFGLGMRVEVVEAIMAESDDRRVLRDVIASVPPAAPEIHAGPGRGHKTVDDIHRLPKGTSAARLIARLKRDHPEIAARLAAGAFRSVRAAAREAGIKVDTPPLVLLRRAWRRASLEERAAFRAEIEGQK